MPSQGAINKLRRLALYSQADDNKLRRSAGFSQRLVNKLRRSAHKPQGGDDKLRSRAHKYLRLEHTHRKLPIKRLAASMLSQRGAQYL